MYSSADWFDGPSTANALEGTLELRRQQAEAYGYINRVLPDAELDAFVEALPARIAMFDKWAIAHTKRLGDYAAGTVVVHEKPVQSVGLSWGSSISHTQTQALSQLAPLTVEELQLVEAFLERRTSLDIEVRRNMARQIAKHIGGSRAVPPEVYADAEKFLESLAEQRRQSVRFR